MNTKFQTAYISINNVPTNILTWGRRIEESLDDVKEIVICITGNPGLPGFYTEFASNIHQNLGPNVPVWVIGHTGHDEPSKKSLHQTPSLHTNEELYTLSGQVKHKAKFIEQYVPKHVKIYLVGHSIGAWIVLELLKNNSIKTSTKKAYLLFPTIERMVDSFNGKLFQFFRFLYPFCIYLLHWICLLPHFVRMFIIRIYFWIFSIPECFVKPALKYSKPRSLEKVIFLAKDEMKTVRELDAEHIKNIKHVLKLYYGATDGWVPVEYFKDIVQKIPDIDAQLCQKGIPHSFVLHHSEIMAKIISDWITQESN